MCLQGPHTPVVRLWGVCTRCGIWWLHSQTYFRIFFGREFSAENHPENSMIFSFKSQSVGGTQSNHHCLEITTRTCSKSTRRPESNMELNHYFCVSSKFPDFPDFIFRIFRISQKITTYYKNLKNNNIRDYQMML